MVIPLSGFFVNCFIALGAFCIYFAAQFAMSFAMTLVSESACMLRFPDATFDQVYDFCEQFIVSHQCFALIFAALFTFTMLWGYFKARGLSPIEELNAKKITLGHTVLFMFIGVILNFAVGIIVSILNQVLVRSGREEQATMTTLAGLVVVLMIVVQRIAELFALVKDLFQF